MLLSTRFQNVYLSFRSFLSSEFVQVTIKILDKDSSNLFLFLGVSSQYMKSLSIRKHKPEHLESSQKNFLPPSLTVSDQGLSHVWHARAGLLDFSLIFLPWASEPLEHENSSFAPNAWQTTLCMIVIELKVYARRESLSKGRDFFRKLN